LTEFTKNIYYRAAEFSQQSSKTIDFD